MRVPYQLAGRSVYYARTRERFLRATLLERAGRVDEALAGAAKLLRRDCVVICEEHGLDRSHGITRHLINELSLHVFVFDPELCHFIRLDGVERLDRIKKHAWVGYNVFATSSTSWEERLLAATWRGR